MKITGKAKMMVQDLIKRTYHVILDQPLMVCVDSTTEMCKTC